MSCMVWPFCNRLAILPEPWGGMSMSKARKAAPQMVCSRIWLVLFFRSDVPIPSSVPVIYTCFHLSPKQYASKKKADTMQHQPCLCPYALKSLILFSLARGCRPACTLASLLFKMRWEEKSGEKGKTCGKQKSSNLVRGCCSILLRLIFYYLLGKAGSSGFKNKCVYTCKQ